jgi:pyruvate dehydrogenase E2 component (dihydrolipoamide acetyltransferase)
MAEFKLPELAEGVDSADVIKVLIDEGDTVEVDQPIMELETEKATAEIPSTVSGTVQHVSVEEGEEVSVGQVLFTYEEKGEETAGDEEKKEAKKKAKKKPAKKEKAEAEKPEADAPDEEAEQKAPEEEARADEAEKEAESGATAEEEPAGAPDEEPPARKAGKERAAPAKPDSSVPAAPTTRRFARELGVDISDVEGSGPEGRVSKSDIKQYLRERRKEAPAQERGRAEPRERPAAEAPPLPDFERWGDVHRQKVRGIRRRTAQYVSQSWRTIPHVTQFDHADIRELERTREALSSEAEEEAGTKLSLTAIAVRIVAEALGRYPKFNATYDEAAEEIVFKDYCNIGVAAATDQGLLVPVLPNADQKGLFDIAAELVDLVGRARDGSIQAREMQGGTFSISNQGSLGGAHFTPIIRYPEAAILGLGQASVPKGAESDGAGPLILPLALSYDHRIIDGAEAVTFLAWIARAFEQPLRLQT